MSATMPAKKSVFVAYFLWLFGGIFGAHHFYLGRDQHGFVWWTTLGGYFGIGWLCEIFKIPGYVRDANEDPKFIKKFIESLKKNKKPPFSTNRFTGMILLGYSWSQLALLAVPEDEIYDINWKFLYWLSPIACALGVWTVGNIGREKGSFWWPLAVAYLIYPIRYYLYDESIWLTLMTTGSAFAFDTYAKKWRRDPPKRKSFAKRAGVVGLCICIYLSLWFSYIYFNGTITDSSGDEIPIREAAHFFFTSPWWVDLKNSLYETYTYAQHHGFYEIWKQIIELSDVHGEQNAYKVLGLGPDASQQEITSSWRRLSKEFHPDKVKDDSLRREAQEKFMEIQQAYEILSNSKHRRQRKNKKDNSS